jgi:hypothetical protein
MAEEAKETGETTQNMHDLSETGAQSVEDLFGPHPSVAQAGVDVGGGLPPQPGPVPVGAADPFTSATLFVTMAARAIWLAIQSGAGG